MDEIFARIDRFFAAFLDEMKTAYVACSNVQNISAWFRRLDELTLARERDVATYRNVEDHIFELKVIHYLNSSFPDGVFTYEPVGINAGGHNCDLAVERQGRRCLIEIKSFHPEFRRRAIPVKRIAQNNKVVMDEESYHSYQATRGHLIDVVYETEEKIANYQPGSVTVLAVPDGFYLNAEDLRDFVFIYRNNHPRPDDPLGPMTMYNLCKPFSMTISEFWAMPFPQQSFKCKDDDIPTVIAPQKHEDRPVTV